jgi:glutamyl endopeptidase
LIGPHTVAIAGHCVYNNGWFPTGTFTPANDTTDNPSCPNGIPFGNFSPSSISVPSGWWQNHDWNYDYAVMDFPNTNPGNTVGWAGTFTMFGVFNTSFKHYPGDKPAPQFWQQIGSIACQSPACSAEGQRLHHQFDIIPGASGGGFISTSTTQLFGIQSTQDSSCFLFSCSYWNTALKWNTSVFNFFHQFNWP